MTIDEMINKLNIERKQQEGTIKYLKYHKEDEHYIAPHREAISDCEQLAEWLEELKAIRQWKADVMEDFCRYDVNSFEELINNTRKKTIDELVNILISYFNGFSHEVYTQVSIKNFICDNIKIIAEKLKEN